MTDKTLADLIVEHGPYKPGGVIPHALGGMLQAGPMNALRDELIEGREAKARLDRLLGVAYPHRCPGCGNHFTTAVAATSCDNEHRAHAARLRPRGDA
ncbi:hypothetical protein AB0M54_24395 [Actinoplanes sp. NPDC051470]|uniref:hypothetical protein n=1 Tax=Actinoplanes sp. NPDC051470 TaxID=3157224 RepID=UPI00341EFC93